MIILAGIGLLAILCQWFAWWVKLPAILFLLLTGIIVGPVLGWLNPDELFGDLLFPIISLGVAIILFEGALTLKFHEIRGLEQVVRRLVTSGVVVTGLVITCATHYLLDFSWQLSFLFGAVMVVTGPTVIVPMLRTVRPNSRIANILRWEGIVIDPIGALLAVLVFEFIISTKPDMALMHSLTVFGIVVAVGLALGALAGYCFGIILRRHWMPEYLHNVAALAFVAGVFVLSNHLQEESGLLAVTVMGMWLANMKGVHTEEILNFKESLSVLMISALFIILAARINFEHFEQLGWAAVGVFVVIQLIARPLKVAVATFGSSLNWRERALLSWIAPRGIVAAAVTVLFAIRLEEQGYQQAYLLVPLAFMVIIGTVVLQSATAGLLARKLGVAEPEPKGFLIIGANTVARTIAKALVDNGYRVLLTDMNWENIATARMAGLATYYGSAVSEHADRHLDLVGMGRMLALTPQQEFNALASMRYGSEFGHNAIYRIPASGEKDRSEKKKIADQDRAQIAFSSDVSFAKLSSLMSQGADIHDTGLTENFSFDDYQNKYGSRAIPLFALDLKNKLHIFTEDHQITPNAGWTVIGLISPDSPPTSQQST